MKRTLLLFALGLSLPCTAWAQSAPSTNEPAKPPPHEGPPPGGYHAMLTDEERQELQAARQAALAANPSLEAEGRDLMKKMNTYQEKLKAAMIKTDPKV